MSMVLAHSGEEDQDSVASDRNQYERRMKPTVMIVEDEEALLTLLQYNLDKEGYKVVTVSDGEEAVLMIKETAPDLVLLDWMLPSLSGIEVCRQLRARNETRNLPIIMITSRTGEKHRDRALSIGVNEYLGKPYQESVLLEAIQRLVHADV